MINLTNIKKEIIKRNCINIAITNKYLVKKVKKMFPQTNVFEVNAKILTSDMNYKDRKMYSLFISKKNVKYISKLDWKEVIIY